MLFRSNLHGPPIVVDVLFFEYGEEGTRAIVVLWFCIRNGNAANLH